MQGVWILSKRCLRKKYIGDVSPYTFPLTLLLLLLLDLQKQKELHPKILFKKLFGTSKGEILKDSL